MKKTLLSLLVFMTMSTTVSAQEAIQLPSPQIDQLAKPLGTVLQQRRSGREYLADRQIDLQTLSTILWAACGVSDPASGKITAPSAINMQDIKVYVCTKDGACLYSPKNNTLIPVTQKDLRDDIAARQAFAKDAPIALVLVSTTEGDNGPNKRFGGTDAGYVSQNIYLACTALGLQTVARAGMNAEALTKELKLGENSILELNHPIGYSK